MTVHPSCSSLAMAQVTSMPTGPLHDRLLDSRMDNESPLASFTSNRLKTDIKSKRYILTIPRPPQYHRYIIDTAPKSSSPSPPPAAISQRFNTGHPTANRVQSPSVWCSPSRSGRSSGGNAGTVMTTGGTCGTTGADGERESLGLAIPSVSDRLPLESPLSVCSSRPSASGELPLGGGGETEL